MAKSAFEKKFRHNLGRVDKRLDAYIEDAGDEKSIRGARTALRRLDATFSLLPKKVRRQNRSKMEKYRKFFKANSRVRDYDIIYSRLVALGAQDAGKALQKKRKAELQRALALARSLKKMAAMRLDGMQDDKLEARIDKSTTKLAGRIKELLPVVLSDDNKVKELHRLRKDCKKLRYVLEMAPAGGNGKYVKMAAKAVRNKDLEELQDRLGAIHDSDVTIAYLQSIKSQLVEKEAVNRKQLYLAFVRFMK